MSEEQDKTSEQKQQIVKGFVVGATEKGEIIFELIGGDNTLLELLGLGQVATLKLNSLINAHFSSGWPLLAEQNTQTIGMLKAVLSNLKANKE